MSGFTALNVEPEDTFEDEIDDTKELQLEEAFKLYNSALRLHSLGPKHYDEAFQAYHELIQTDIFKDPDFVSGYAQDQIEDSNLTDLAVSTIDNTALPLLPTNAAESAANSIPQLIFLSFKNRGQFVLDWTRHQLRPQAQRDPTEKASIWTDACRKALGDFADALERDDSDLDLWKKAARVAEVFSSQRIVRFCLESVLAGDDDGSSDAIDLSGLDEAFAAGELTEVLGLLNDSLSQRQMLDVQPKQLLLGRLKRYNDPFPFLPSRTKNTMYATNHDSLVSFTPKRYVLRPGARSWMAVGHELIQALLGEQQGTLHLGPGAAISIQMPDDAEMEEAGMLQPEQVERVAPGHPITERAAKIQSNGMLQEVMAESPPKGDPVALQLATQTETVDDDVAEAEVKDTETVGDCNQQGESEDASSAIAQGTAGNPLPVDLPTRKRSSTVAGNDDAPEARSKSKRLRARESMAEIGQQDEEIATDLSKYYSEQLETYAVADQWMFAVVNDLLSKVDVEPMGSYDEIKTDFERDLTIEGMPEEPVNAEGVSRVIQLSDLRHGLASWTDEMSQAILYGHGSQDLGGQAGLTLFQQHSKTKGQYDSEIATSKSEQGLEAFIDNVNTDWTNLHDASMLWLGSLLSLGATPSFEHSSYLREKWSKDLKQIVVQLIHREDEYIYETLRKSLQTLQADNKSTANSSLLANGSSAREISEFVESLFELHLDVYSLITNPSSQVDQQTRLQQHDRLSRWADLANECLNAYKKNTFQLQTTDILVLRFIWASTIYATMADDVAQDHVMLCLQDLESLMQQVESSSIILPNNAAMPEISAAAAQQEMSRLSTLDFFMSVFDSDASDPIAVIERLEPILEHDSLETVEDTAHVQGIATEETTQVEKLTSFLESGDISLKLYLWKRLRDAYHLISYSPKTVSCNLRALETIMSELRSSRHLRSSQGLRIISTLKWLKDADELVVKLLLKVLHDTNAFECIDEHHLQTSVSAVAQLSRLLHGFTLFEDSVRVGKISNPLMKSTSSTRSFEKCKDRFREMQVRAWTLQYALLKEAATQFPHEFENTGDGLVGYLRSVHNSLGLRQYCRYSNKVFLKLVKTELLSIGSYDAFSADIFQVLFDLHQLKFAPGVGDSDHGCPPETLDKKTAVQMVQVIMSQVSRMNIKDLLKNELKGTIEKIQQALGSVKSSPELSHNKRIISQFLKSQINPKELYRCIKGIGNLGSKPVHADSAVIAGHGWYFLLGHIALTRFKSVKRINPTPTDDLDIATTFFRHDLEHDNEKWESWYRLAQIHDAKIEEDLVWNVSKINDHRPELATLQRHAIHAYTMAVATAMRNADDNADTTQKISEMFSDFATRLYASSRQPLTMEAFKTDHSLRHFSNGTDQTMYKGLPYQPIRVYAVWNFAAYLLRRKLSTKPKPWTSYYTLGKCLWKMYCSPDQQLHTHKITADEVIEAFTEAIEALPARKDTKGEYILEPHFKLASIVHKMVHRKSISPAQGVEYLQATFYARKIFLSEDENGPDWEGYILEVLKKLGQADKQNWHHRIIARAAHILYDDTQDLQGALGARHEFTQQIFTKTMTMQVWKPEFERAGRHYVYTTRYVSFFVTLLDKLNDRANFDLVLRRVRRKPTEFLEHQTLWEEITTKYAKLLRRIGKIAEGQEKAVFEPLSFEDFTAISDQLEKWAHDPDTTSIVLDVVRDAIELKKLNNSLMKGPMFDDLICDAYASMYEAFVSQLPPDKPPTPVPPPPPAPNQFGPTPTAQGESWDRMRLGNVLGPQVDDPGDVLSRPLSMHGPVGLGLHTSHLVMGGGPPTFVEPPRMPTPVKPGRAKQITKREIMRKAEAAIVKPPPIKTPTLSKKPIVEINTPSRIFGNVEMDLEIRAGSRIDDIKDEVAVSEMSSRVGSVHDSADDESELSDVDERDEDGSEQLLVVKSKAIFPGLVATQSKDGEDEAEADALSHIGDGEANGQEDLEMNNADDTGEDADAVWHDAEERPLDQQAE